MKPEDIQLVEAGQVYTTEGCKEHCYYPNPYRMFILVASDEKFNYTSFEFVGGEWIMRTEKSNLCDIMELQSDLAKECIRLLT